MQTPQVAAIHRSLLQQDMEEFRQWSRAGQGIPMRVITDLATQAYIIAEGTDNPQERELCERLEEMLARAEHSKNFTLEQHEGAAQAIMDLEEMYQAQTPSSPATPTLQVEDLQQKPA